MPWLHFFKLNLRRTTPREDCRFVCQALTESHDICASCPTLSYWLVSIGQAGFVIQYHLHHKEQKHWVVPQPASMNQDKLCCINNSFHLWPSCVHILPLLRQHPGTVYQYNNACPYLSLWTDCIMLRSSWDQAGPPIFPQRTIREIRSVVKSNPSAGPLDIKDQFLQPLADLLQKRTHWPCDGSAPNLHLDPEPGLFHTLLKWDQNCVHTAVSTRPVVVARQMHDFQHMQFYSFPSTNIHPLTTCLRVYLLQLWYHDVYY